MAAPTGNFPPDEGSAPSPTYPSPLPVEREKWQCHFWHFLDFCPSPPPHAFRPSMLHTKMSGAVTGFAQLGVSVEFSLFPKHAERGKINCLTLYSFFSSCYFLHSLLLLLNLLFLELWNKINFSLIFIQIYFLVFWLAFGKYAESIENVHCTYTAPRLGEVLLVRDRHVD